MLKIQDDCRFLIYIEEFKIFINKQIQLFQDLKQPTFEPMRSQLLDLSWKKKEILDLITRWKHYPRENIKLSGIINLANDYENHKKEVIKDYEIPDIPSINEKKIFLEKKKECLKSLVRFKQTTYTSDRCKLEERLLILKLEIIKFSISLIIQKSELEKVPLSLGSSPISDEDTILYMLKIMSLSDLKVSNNSYSLEVTRINLKTQKKKLNGFLEEIASNKKVLKTNSHYYCTSLKNPCLIFRVKILNFVRKIYFLKLIQNYFRRHFYQRKYLLKKRCYLREYLEPKISKCIFEIKCLENCPIPCMPLTHRFLSLYKLKYKILSEFMNCNLKSLSFEQQFTKWYQLIQTRDRIKRKLIINYQIPLVISNLDYKSDLCQKLLGCRHKIQYLQNLKVKTKISKAQLSIENIKNCHLRNSQILIDNHLDLQRQLTNKWGNIDEQLLTPMKRFMRALDCLDMDDLPISLESYNKYVTNIDLLKKEKLLRDFIEQEKTDSGNSVNKIIDKSSKKKKKSSKQKLKNLI